MSRWERYGTRDMAYSRWHRNLPDDYGRQLKFIDLDGIEVCDACGAILALVETAQDVGQPFKAATIMTRLARQASVEAYIVLYSKDGEAISSFRIKRAWPTPTNYFRLTPTQWHERIRRMRRCHPLEMAA